MNQAYRFSCAKILIIFGFTLIALSFTLGIVTFVIPQWHNITASGGTGWTNFSRTSGIFQECLIIPQANIDITTPYSVRYGCVDIDFGQYTEITTKNDSYNFVIRMRQSQIGLHSATLLLLLFVLLMGIGIFIKWCQSFADSVFYVKWRYALGFFSILAFLCFSASSSIGTALNMLYNNSSNYSIYLPNSPNTTNAVKFGYMFYLAWTGSFTTLLASILLFISAHIGKNIELEKYKPHIMSIDNPAFAPDENIYPQPIFLEPNLSSKNDFNSVKRSTNNNNSPGLLPRYELSGPF